MGEPNQGKIGEVIVLFLFYSESSGIQAKLSFSDTFKHCHAIVYDGDAYILIEFDRYGIKCRVIKVQSMSAIIRNIKAINALEAIVCVEVAKRKAYRWSPWWVRSCNELCRYAAGVDIGFSFNPVHLYSKLLRYNGKRNYEILYAWRR